MNFVTLRRIHNHPASCAGCELGWTALTATLPALMIHPDTRSRPRPPRRIMTTGQSFDYETVLTLLPHLAHGHNFSL